MRHGPEYQRGWRTTIEVDGEAVVIEARHHSRNRVPRGHEIARQMMRGKPYGMVEEVSHEWQAHLRRGGRPATIRVHPNGFFHVPPMSRAHRTIEDAARAWAEPKIAAFRAAQARAKAPPAEPDEGALPTP